MTISQKKKVTKKTLDQAVMFMEDYADAIKQGKNGESAVYEPELRLVTSALIREAGNKGCKDTKVSPFARMTFEKMLFPFSEDKLYGSASFMAFLSQGFRELYPNAVRTHLEDQEFTQYFMKFSLVCREMLVKCLRNPARQKRNLNRLFDDLNILMQEANYTDDLILNKHRERPSQTNTVALNMSLSLVSRAQFEYVHQGFALEIYGMHELPMVFAMLKVSSNLIF